MTDQERQQQCRHSYWEPCYTRAGDLIGYYCRQCDKKRTLGEPDLPEVEVTRRTLMERLMARPGHAACKSSDAPIDGKIATAGNAEHIAA